MGKGSQYERDLVDELETRGYVAMRAGASGAGTARPLPDVLALQPGPEPGTSAAYAIELKNRRDGYASFTNQEITYLNQFATDAGATPLVVVRPNFRLKDTPDQWCCFPTDGLNKTDGGFSVLKSMLPGQSLTEKFGPVLADDGD